MPLSPTTIKSHLIFSTAMDMTSFTAPVSLAVRKRGRKNVYEPSWEGEIFIIQGGEREDDRAFTCSYLQSESERDERERRWHLSLHGCISA